MKRLPDSSVSSLIQAGRCEEGHPATKNSLQHSHGYWIDNCLMATKRDFFEMEASLSLNERSQNESVAKSWLSILCCWEAAVHTLDQSWKKMDIELMTIMMMMISKMISNIIPSWMPPFYYPRKSDIVVHAIIYNL